jgi:P27 family predicted phage terminase small subunit
MKTGRKPKPRFLKELSGNPGHRPLPTDEPEGVGDLWAPPSYMDAEQREQWHYVVDHAPPGLLTGTDRDILAVFCNACVEYRRAVVQVRAMGQVVKTGVVTDKDGNTSGGNVIQNPFLGIMNRQALLLNRFGAECGFSPAARASLGSRAPEFNGRGAATGDLLDAYLATKPDKLDS